jgi:hypothetical protein
VRTTPAGPGVRAGRLAKAEQFAGAARDVLLLADEASDVADAFVTLAVHSGIAAADAICCARLGEYSRSERHQDAIGVLARADAAGARHLRVLLGMKTAAGYSSSPVTAENRIRAERAMDALLVTARTTGPG